MLWLPAAALALAACSTAPAPTGAVTYRIQLCSPVPVPQCPDGEVTAAQIESVRARLAALPGEPSVDFVTKEESLARLADRTGTATLVLMPQAFEVTSTDPASVEAAFAELAALPGVAVIGRAPVPLPVPSGS